MKNTTNYTNKYVDFSDNRFIRCILKYPAGGIASHWLFQGLLYMDPTERWFKLGLDAIMTLAGYLIMRGWILDYCAFVLALLIAHTINFLFNGQVWVVLKHYGWVSNSYEDFQKFTNVFIENLQSEKSIVRLLAYGSLSGNEWRESSDLDIRVIRKTGFGNGICVCWLVLKERTRALLCVFPLDVFVLDSKKSLAKLHGDEEAIDLLEQRFL